METPGADGRALPDPERLAHLVQVGCRCLEEVYQAHGYVPHEPWSRAVREALGGAGREVEDAYLLWLWSSLRAESYLAPDRPLLLGGGDERAGRQPRIDVLPAGSALRIHLPGAPAAEDDPPTAVALLQETLRMKPGKGGRLECCAAATDLVVRLPGHGSLAAEAEAFMVSTEAIREEGERLIVRVGSLNQAYTRASLRLERGRSTHGGSVYTNLAWLHDKGRLTLDRIRAAVERGEWQLPLRPDSLFPAARPRLAGRRTGSAPHPSPTPALPGLSV